MTKTSTAIGIFGGSFNPVHLGHLIAANDVIETLDLRRLYWVPAACSPLKIGRHLAGAEDRCAMVAAAIAGDRRMALSRWEVQRGEPSYTIATVRHFRARFPGAELYLVIGSDTLRDLHRWHEVHALLKLCRLAIVARPGHPPRWPTQRLRLPDPPPVIIRGHSIGISSTEVRRRLAEGKSIRYFVPPPVADYLQRRRLYRRLVEPATGEKGEHRVH